MITLTTNEMAKYEPCDRFYTKYLPALGKDKPDDEPLTFAQIAKVASFKDIIWCLRCFGYKHTGKRLEFARRCADRVAYLISDENSEKENNVYAFAMESMKFANYVEANHVMPLYATEYVTVVRGASHYAAEAVAANAAGKYWYAAATAAEDSPAYAARENEQAAQLKILLEIMGR